MIRHEVGVLVLHVPDSEGMWLKMIDSDNHDPKAEDTHTRMTWEKVRLLEPYDTL